MELSKKDLVQLLHGQGDNDTADRADAQLPDTIDTDRDSDALSAVGLDQQTLLAKLAAGGIGGNLAI